MEKKNIPCVQEEDIKGPPKLNYEDVHIDDFQAIGTIAVAPQRNQQKCIQRALHVPDADQTFAQMTLSNEVINEFSTPYTLLWYFKCYFLMKMPI